MDSESALYSLEEYRRCFSKPEPSYDANTCLVKHKRLRKRNVSPVAQKKARTHKKLNKQKRKMQCGGEQISKELSREVYFMSESEDDRLLVLLYCGHRSLVLYLPLTTTINELKHKLADVTQIPIENQRIFYGNTQVTKEQKLADFKCSTICLALVEGPVCGGDGDLQSSEENDDDEFYEVEKILEVRLNKKYHSEEYKVRFKGYGPEDDMWLPSSSFREPVQFQTVSQRGRVRQHTTKDESEGPPKKAGQLDVQKHGTKNSKGRLSNNINDKNTKSLDVKSRKRCQRKRKDTSFQPHGGKKGKYPTDDFGPETSGAIEIDVECGTTSLPLPKPSDSNTLAQERDRGVKRKKGKKKSNGSKFRKSLVSTFNSSKVTLTDSEDDSSLPEKGGLPQQVQGSKDVVGPSMVCCGSFHQSEHEDFHYPGQQCAAMALTALLYTTVKPIDTWQGSDIDYVLLVGDKLHFLQLCHIGRSVHSDSKLALDELPSDVQCFKFQFSVKTEITGGTIDKKQTIGADELAGLEEIFENCQECKAVGVVLRILEYTLACAHSYSMWYVIDSHARDSSGMINDQGSSVVIQFPNYMSLLHYIRCFVEHATSERDINQNDLTFEALTLQVRERKPISSEEHLVLPVTTLLTYRTSLGGIDLFNTFASCLERGKKINDDLLDFFLISTAENQLNQIMKKQIFIFNSCFYKKLIQFNPQAIRKWTKDTDIFSKKYLFMPICKDLHWLLVIIKNGRTTSIMILDSLNGEHALLEKRVKRYLQDEWAAKEKQQPRGTKKPLAIEEIHYPLVPKQTNDKDCGLYVMKCFEEFLKDSENKPFESWRPNFSQRDTTLLRKTIKFFIQEEISKLH